MGRWKTHISTFLTLVITGKITEHVLKKQNNKKLFFVCRGWSINSNVKTEEMNTQCIIMTTFWGRGHTLLVFYWAVTRVLKAKPKSDHHYWQQTVCMEYWREKTSLCSTHLRIWLVDILHNDNKKKKKQQPLFRSNIKGYSFVVSRNTLSKIHCYPLKH